MNRKSNIKVDRTKLIKLLGPGRTQEEFCREHGFNTAWLTNVGNPNGKQFVGPKNYKRLLDAFGVKPKDIFFTVD